MTARPPGAPAPGWGEGQRGRRCSLDACHPVAEEEVLGSPEKGWTSSALGGRPFSSGVGTA